MNCYLSVFLHPLTESLWSLIVSDETDGFLMPFQFSHYLAQVIQALERELGLKVVVSSHAPIR